MPMLVRGGATVYRGHPARDIDAHRFRLSDLLAKCGFGCNGRCAPPARRDIYY
jgi:hypothetical protein